MIINLTQFFIHELIIKNTKKKENYFFYAQKEKYFICIIYFINFIG